MGQFSKRATRLARVLPTVLAAVCSLTLIALVVGIPLWVESRSKGPFTLDIRRVPDVVIEREMFRRIGLLNSDNCTFCREHWRTCQCEMGKHPLMFQNREQQSPEMIKTELLKYGVHD